MAETSLRSTPSRPSSRASSGAPIATTTYIMGGLEETKAILEDQDGIQHACEGETSMMMAVQPDLVDHSRLPQAHGASLDIAGALARPIHVWKSFKELTPSGVMGDARRATPAKGEAILDACAKGIARGSSRENLGREVHVMPCPIGLSAPSPSETRRRNSRAACRRADAEPYVLIRS